MTLSEAKDLLVGRVGFRDDKTVTGFVLDAANSTSDSGRYFQGEHSAITLENIRDCQPVRNISADAFNAYLTDLKTQTVIQVLGDCFERDYVNDNLLTLYPTAFDTAISLRMVIVVAELITTSTRSNDITRFTKDFFGKLNYDLYRDTVTKFANKSNYKYTLGIASRYGEEVESVQRRFGSQKNLLKTITKGATYNEWFPAVNENLN